MTFLSSLVQIWTRLVADSRSMAPKALLCSCILVLVAVIQAFDVGYISSDLQSDSSIAALFDRWCSEHGKRYGNAAEKNERLQIFKDKLFQIDAHNQLEQHSFKQGLNQFSDLTLEEVQPTVMKIRVADLTRNAAPPPTRRTSRLSAPPPSIDWRWKGAVTRVKDVGLCRGATWTYAAGGAVEGGLKVSGYPLADLSAQQLLDCVQDYNRKCNFGNPTAGLEYVLENGIAKANAYPEFTGANQTCKPLPNEVVTISGVERVWGSSDDTDLLEAVATQPVAVLVDGSSSDFINYKYGIFNGSCSSDVISQSLLIVGYGTTSDGLPYWTARNSWGFSWGESGYIRIPRNTGLPLGKCAINSFPSYPTGTAPGSRSLKCDAGQTCPSGMTCCCREPMVGSKCTSHMCCPDKYSDCKNGCCNEKRVSSSTEQLVFTTTASL